MAHKKGTEIKVSNTQADLSKIRGPDETVGGTRIKKQGPEIKISNKQEDLSKLKRKSIMTDKNKYTRTSAKPDITYVHDTGGKTDRIIKKKKLIKKSSKLAGGGRAGFQHGGRTNLLEELGRVEAEPSNRNRRAEISRVHGELNRGYKGGKRVKKSLGGAATHGFNKNILRSH